MSETLETVWHGGLWREFDPPVVGTLPDTRLDLYVSDRIASALTRDWQTPRQIGAKLGKTNTDAVGMALARLAQKGRAERSLGPSTGGRPGWRYRRVA